MKEKLQEILPRVTKPTRYLGTELNSVHKNLDEMDVKFCFAFPDVYEVGMSHLGLRILYHLLNEQPGVACERTFAPWVDMEEEMHKAGLPLFSLESLRPVRDFDLVGFTLQYEMSFSNILNMLHLAGIPLRTKDRGPEDPFILGGGPCAYNPEPLAPFFDFIVLGEGEEVILEIVEAYKQWKRSGDSREGFLQQVAALPGVYVPSFYEVLYKEDGTVKQVKPNRPEVPATVTKRIIEDLDKAYFPTKPIVPFMEIVHDRIMLEVFRGCARGCRFCQAGVIYRPVREKQPEVLKQQARELVDRTGYSEISLASLSTADYSAIGELVHDLLDEFAEQGVGVSLPSLRLDAFSIDLAKEVQRVRKTGLTFAPEAGTQRLRNVINKNVKEQNLVDAVSAAFAEGWTSVKLYFMIGLPTETREDLDGIAHMARLVVDTYRRIKGAQKGKGVKVTVSTSSFVPKAHTPFQWVAQDPVPTLQEKQEYLKKIMRDRQIEYNWHDAELSFIEAIFARGDRRVADVLERAWRKGCKFDGWSEHFHFDRWMEAFAECGLEPAFYANRVRNYQEVLPWDHLTSGVDKYFLWQEYEAALAEQTTRDCRNDCALCGICGVLGTQILVNGRGQGR